MDTFLGTLLIVGLAMLAMAAGVMLSGRRLKGSCGGVGTGCPCTDEERQACAAKRRGS